MLYIINQLDYINRNSSDVYTITVLAQRGIKHQDYIDYGTLEDGLLCVKVHGDTQKFEQDFNTQVVTEVPLDYYQQDFNGEKFGQYLDIATIQQLETLREGLTDEEFAEADTIKELHQLKRIKDLTNDIDELALMILANEGVL